MGIVNKILGTFVGNKADRDIKEVTPAVNKVTEEYSKLQGLSNDELRGLTVKLKERIRDYIKKDEAEIQKLRNSIVEKKLYYRRRA